MTTPTTLAPGLDVSPIGLGGMALTHVYGQTDTEQAIATVHHAIDAGVTFIDTADVYGEPAPGAVGPAGTNEEMLSRVLAERRDEVQLATKFGITGNPADGGVRGDRDYVRSACEASLRRLGVETIDLYYMHRRELSRPIEETVAAMAELVDEGKVRHLGLSEVTAEELRAATSVHPIAAVQSEWSIWSRDVERHVVPAAAELGVGFVPYSPLGRGFLTGAMTRDRVAQTVALGGEARFDTHFDANQAVVAGIEQVAEQLGATPAQTALAWLLTRGDLLGLPVVPIPGTRRPERIDENLAALDLTLTGEQLEALDRAGDLVQGGRGFSWSSPDWISSGRE